MFEAADIGDWIGKDVLDLEGAKVGTLESAYFDTATEHPTFGAVQVGMVGCHRLADREADLAMYRAKADGRDRISIALGTALDR